MDVESPSSRSRRIRRALKTPEGSFVLFSEVSVPVHSRRRTNSPNLVSYRSSDHASPSYLCFKDGLLYCHHDNMFFVYDTEKVTLSQEPIVAVPFPRAPCAIAIRPGEGEVSANAMELLVALESGDIIVYCPQREETRLTLNEDGIVDSSEPTSIEVVSSTEFLVCHQSGSVYLYDTNRVHTKELELRRSNSYDVISNKNERFNPVWRWPISESPLLCMSTTVDKKLFAVGDRDGTVRVCDLSSIALLLSFKSYYGAVLSVAWSPDGKYLAAGGEDDMIIIVDPHNPCVLAQCVGHVSWVSSIVFDAARCSSMIYRLLSTGHDGFLCIWEFGKDALDCLRKEEQIDGFGEDVNVSHLGSFSRSEVSVFDPLSSRKIHTFPIVGLLGSQSMLFTICIGGILRMWRFEPSESVMDEVLFLESDNSPRENTKSPDDQMLSGINIHVHPDSPITPAKSLGRIDG